MVHVGQPATVILMNGSHHLQGRVTSVGQLPLPTPNTRTDPQLLPQVAARPSTWVRLAPAHSPCISSWNQVPDDILLAARYDRHRAAARTGPQEHPMTLDPRLAVLLTPNRQSVLFLPSRASIAMALALYVSMLLQLDRPYWALYLRRLSAKCARKPDWSSKRGLCQIGGTLVGGAAGLC